MDPYDPAPQLQQIATTHTIAATPPDSTAPGELPQLEGGQGNERFSSVDEVIARVRQLHEVVDEDVAPHKSKYAARMIMTDILTILKPLLQKHSDSPATVQWVTEQIGRLEYLNGVNHIEAEETSAGEKMLQKAMLKFKDAAERYPFDVIDGYNHLAIVWSNRTQHAVAHAYLQVAQHVFLRFKKLRAAALALLSPEEKKLVSERDHAEQQAEAIDEVQQMDQQQQQHKIVEYTEEDERRDALLQPLAITSIPPSTPGYSFVQPSYWHRLEVNHTLTLFFLAQVFGHMKKRDLAAIYAHLCLNRQLKQKKDFQRTEWVTNAIGLSFYYSGRKMFQQAHHCLLAAQSFVKDDDMPKKMNTPTADTSRDQQLAADLCRAWGAFYLKWLQRSRDLLIETEALPSVAASMANAAASDPTLADISKASGTSAFTSPASAGAGKPDEHGEADPTSSLSSLPPAELAELKRLQRLDRERERHFENQIEEEADEEEGQSKACMRASREKFLKFVC
jgi:hypothetical protein